MNPNHEQMILKTVEQALLMPTEQRSRFVENALSDNQDLIPEAKALLSSYFQIDSFMELPPVNIGDWLLNGQSSLAMHPEQIGPFQILECLGEGGMGCVYLGKQEKPIIRKVAIKILKRDVASEKLIARFQVEHQILASLQHENIATVFESGTHEGLPYFTMEYVAGLPITAFCREHHLGLEERLELFLQVCAGVAHAHERGILHRDLKPSNIIASNRDGKVIVKIIDFGIAKAMHQTVLPNAPHTMHGHILGTPLYMSPEQILNHEAYSDTRVDVFALGAILYEVLLDAPRVTLKGGNESMLEILKNHAVQEVPPVSIKASQLKSSPFKPAVLKGELDWIVSRALARNRNDRYASVHDLARDILRYFEGLPVEAGPKSVWYFLRKWLSRHQLAFSFCSIILFTLVGAMVLIHRSSQKAELQQNRATAAESRINTAQELLSLSWNSGDNFPGRPQTINILETTIDGLEQDLSQYPFLLARVEERLARALADLGEVERAKVYLKRAKQRLPRDASWKNRTLSRLAVLEGRLLLRTGEYQRAERYFRTLSLQLEDQASPEVIQAKRGICDALRLQGKVKEAIPLYKALIESGAPRAQTNPDMLLTIRALGNAYLSANQLEDAESSYRQALEGQRIVLGSTHRETMSSWENLAVVMLERGRFVEAGAALKQVEQIRELTLGAFHPDTLRTKSWQGVVYFRLHQLEKARDLLEETHLVQKALLTKDAVDTQRTVANLASVYGEMGNHSQAATLLQSLLEDQERKLGSDHPEVLRNKNNLAHHLMKMGDLEHAFQRSLEVFQSRTRIYGPDHRKTLMAQCTLAQILMEQQKFSDSYTLISEVVNVADKTFPVGHPFIFVFRGYLGRNLRLLERYSEAAPLLETSYWELKKKNSPYRFEILQDLLDLHSDWKTEQKAQWLLESKCD